MPGLSGTFKRHLRSVAAVAMPLTNCFFHIAASSQTKVPGASAKLESTCPSRTWTQPPPPPRQFHRARLQDFAPTRQLEHFLKRNLSTLRARDTPRVVRIDPSEHLYNVRNARLDRGRHRTVADFYSRRARGLVRAVVTGRGLYTPSITAT